MQLLKPIVDLIKYKLKSMFTSFKSKKE